MTGIFSTLFWILLAVLVIKLAVLVLRRLSLHIKIMRMGRLGDVEVRTLRSPLSSLLKITDKPSYSVRVNGVVYYVRVYNGVGAGKVVHFASERYTVRFTRLVTASYSHSRGGKRLHGFSRGVSVGSKVIILPPLSVPQDHPAGLAACEVMIFNPAPGEVSYVTEERTRIEVAFTGDEIYGTKIFTKKTFATFIDRVSRGVLFVPKDVYVFDDIYK